MTRLLLVLAAAGITLSSNGAGRIADATGRVAMYRFDTDLANPDQWCCQYSRKECPRAFYSPFTCHCSPVDLYSFIVEKTCCR